VERALGYAGLRLELGAFRAPARIRAGGECMVWWVGSGSLDLVATKVDGKLTELVRKVDGARFLKREAKEEVEQDFEIVEAMWSVVHAGGRCRCEVCRVERRRQ